MSFERALPIILKAEGGYVNDPADRGGATNRGITQATFDRWLVSVGRVSVPVKEITDDEVATIYRTRYWNEIKGDGLPWPASLVAFDAAVNHGVGRATKMLQDAAGVFVDGKIGPKTLAAVHADPDGVAKALVADREAFYRLLAINKTQAKFLKGWLNRLEHLKAAM